MELVVSASNAKLQLEPSEDYISKHSGFLNSEYKNVVTESLKDTSSKSIFGIRRRIKNTRYQLTSGAEVTLKVCAFVAIIISIFN